MSQGEFCSSLFITAGYLSGIENGKGNPGIKFFIELTDRYKVNMNYLFYGSGKMFIDEKAPLPWDSREILDDIEDPDDIMWFIKNSPIFRNEMFVHAAKFLYDNKVIIHKNIENFRKKGEKE